jgi:hypothetical protein
MSRARDVAGAAKRFCFLELALPDNVKEMIWPNDCAMRAVRVSKALMKYMNLEYEGKRPLAVFEKVEFVVGFDTDGYQLNSYYCTVLRNELQLGLLAYSRVREERWQQVARHWGGSKKELTVKGWGENLGLAEDSNMAILVREDYARLLRVLFWEAGGAPVRSISLEMAGGSDLCNFLVDLNSCMNSRLFARQVKLGNSPLLLEEMTLYIPLRFADGSCCALPALMQPLFRVSKVAGGLKGPVPLKILIVSFEIYLPKAKSVNDFDTFVQQEDKLFRKTWAQNVRDVIAFSPLLEEVTMVFPRRDAWTPHENDFGIPHDEAVVNRYGCFESTIIRALFHGVALRESFCRLRVLQVQMSWAHMHARNMAFLVARLLYVAFSVEIILRHPRDLQAWTLPEWSVSQMEEVFDGVRVNDQARATVDETRLVFDFEMPVIDPAFHAEVSNWLVPWCEFCERRGVDLITYCSNNGGDE